MVTIHEALRRVPNASEADVSAIVTTLSLKHFECATMTIDGPFQQLDMPTLTGFGLDDLQVAIVLSAQKGAGQNVELNKRSMRPYVQELVEESLKRQKYSVTDAKHVGQSILNVAETGKTMKELLGNHCNRPLPKSLNKTFKKKWKIATNESQLQPLLVQAMQVMCVLHNVLDTHEWHFYKVPAAKIDIALSGSKQVFYRWEKVQDVQPERQRMTTCIMGKDSIQLWRFCKNGGHACTELLPFDWDQSSLGYQALLTFVSTSASNLGFVAWDIPAPFTTSTSARVPQE